MTDPYQPQNDPRSFSPYGNTGPGLYDDPNGNYGQSGYGQGNSYNGYQQFYGTPYAMVPTAARKEPALSLIISFFIPGVGSMINGDIGKGVGILVLYAIGILLSIVLIGLPIVLGAWVWGLIDAYQGAVAFNRRNGYIG